MASCAFAKNFESIEKLKLSQLSEASECIMGAERSHYLFKNIRKLTDLGEIVYRLHSNRGPLKYRDTSCPPSSGDFERENEAAAEVSIFKASGENNIHSETVLVSLKKLDLVAYALPKTNTLS